MQEIRRRRVSVIGLRAAFPKFVRVLALLVLVAGVVYVGLSYYRSRKNKDFRLLSGPAQLSKEVVGVIEGLEHREMKDGRLYVLLKAARDVTFSDGHHELENVYLEVHPEKGDRPDKITAQRTVTNGDNTQFIFQGAVNIETRDGLIAKSDTVQYDLRSETGVATAPLEFTRDNIHGRADGATVEAKNKRLELRGGVEITVDPDARQGAGEGGIPRVNLRGRPVTIKSAQANFDQANLRMDFTGRAVAEQGADVISGDTLTGVLSEQKRVRQIEVRGSSYLRSATQGRAAEIFAADMDFFFNPDQKLERAQARNNVRAHSLDADSEVQMNAPGNVEVNFLVQNEQSLLREMRSDSRSVVTMAAPKSKAGDPKAANKTLTADTIRLQWRATGRDLERAEADGNAELRVEPVQQTPTADRKMLYAPHFDCDFYESGNLARTFTANGGAKAVIDPVQPSDTRATRTLTSSTMIAQFVRETQDVDKLDANGEARFVERERTMTAQKMTASFGRDTQLERVDASGDSKFNEQDRNAQAANMTYTAGDGYVRLRGGEPVVWDSRARLRAAEIDSDTRNKISYGRGKTTTTYYSQEQTGGATPFGNLKSPVFIVANAAEFQHDTGIGIYTGNARAWQDDNFVKANRIKLQRDIRRMDGEGSVQSALYQARRKDPNGARSVVPVFATSDRMFYVEGERLLHYEGNVDIKQGTERITSAVADVFLLKETYEVDRTVAQQNVVVTQPGKRGTGDWAQYTASDETVMLTGAPARVEDAQQGMTESRRLTVFLRENRVVSDSGDSRQGTGRVRTVHKVKKQADK